jgi:predicted nucleic acid-binding protein
VSALVVDTSIWIDAFRGRELPDLESALSGGTVLLSPLVAAELLSAPLGNRRRAELLDFLSDLPLAETSFEHWARVGLLRSRLRRVGLSVSTPDAHVAQCAIDVQGSLWSRDRVFERIAKAWPLRLRRQ